MTWTSSWPEPSALFRIAAFVAHRNAPLIDGRAAARGRIAKEGGDARAGAKSSDPAAKGGLIRKTGSYL